MYILLLQYFFFLPRLIGFFFSTFVDVLLEGSELLDVGSNTGVSCCDSGGEGIVISTFGLSAKGLDSNPCSFGRLSDLLSGSDFAGGLAELLWGAGLGLVSVCWSCFRLKNTFYFPLGA